MRQVLMYLWQLPQHLLGLLLVWLYKPTRLHKVGDVRFYFSHRMSGGISLGNYIIVNDGHYRKYFADSWKRNTVKHEYGHSIQSLRLGWLYLFVIGLPSLIWALIYGVIIPKTHNGYYRFYTEKWADKLVNIKR